MSPTIAEDTASSPRGCLPLFSIYEDSVVTARGAGADDVFKAVFEDQGPTAEYAVIPHFSRHIEFISF